MEAWLYQSPYGLRNPLRKRNQLRFRFRVSIPVRVKELVNDNGHYDWFVYQSPYAQPTCVGSCTFASESGLRNNKILCSTLLYTIVLGLSSPYFIKNMKFHTWMKCLCFGYIQNIPYKMLFIEKWKMRIRGDFRWFLYLFDIRNFQNNRKKHIQNYNKNLLCIRGTPRTLSPTRKPKFTAWNRIFCKSHGAIVGEDSIPMSKT